MEEQFNKNRKTCKFRSKSTLRSFKEYKRNCDVAAQLTVHTDSQEYKRDCDTAAQLNLQAVIRNNKTTVEEEYTRKAVKYRDFLKRGNERERERARERERDKSALIVMLESLRSENLFLNVQNGQEGNILLDLRRGAT